MDHDTLHEELNQLRFLLREKTFKEHKRINPFFEDLISWEENGNFLGCKNTRVYNSTTIIGDVKIGNNCWIGPFTMLDGTGGIEIGDWCSISTGVQIYTHDAVKSALSAGKLPYDYSPVKIGCQSFIGAGAIILRGVTIGSQCVVGAGAVINKSFPDRCVIAGVPGKKVKDINIEELGK